MKNITILVCGVLLAGCMSFEITESPLRNEVSKALQINQDLSLRSTGEIQIGGDDFLPASIQILFEDKIIYIDPIQITDMERADYIFITHGHMDHFSLEDIQRLSHGNTQIYCPVRLLRKIPMENVTGLHPGKAVELEGFSFQTMESYTERSIFLGMKAHPRRHGNLAYLFNFNGLRLLHAGDSDALEGFHVAAPVDVAILPIGGDKLTMDWKEALGLAELIQAKWFIPIHYTLGNPESQVILRSLEEQMPDSVDLHWLDSLH